MFALYFFTGDNPDLAVAICDCTLTGSIYVREGEFDTLQDALHRLDNIGSRWVFYPNACIVQDCDGERSLAGIYMQD
jgi:hypothetical protein